MSKNVDCMACVAAMSTDVPRRRRHVLTRADGVTHCSTRCLDLDGYRDLPTCLFHRRGQGDSDTRSMQWFTAWDAAALPGREQE